MVVGSKVRMLHGQGEGVITRIQGDQATVLLNEGLEIPFRLKDLVAVATRHEVSQVEKADPRDIPMLARKTSRMFFVKDGVFLAGISSSPMLVDFSLVNHSDYHLAVAVYKIVKPVNQFFTFIQLKPKSFLPLPAALPFQETHHLVGLAFQILKHHPDQGDMVPVAEYRLAFSQINWEGTRQQIPLMEKPGYLIQLDAEPVKVDPVALREKMLGSERKEVPVPKQTRPAEEVREFDLHIEKLRSDYRDLTASQMMEAQLGAFEKALDKALADGVSQLILIHGVGSGVLKEEIHRRLGKNPAVRHFKDARKEKFGYGATEVQL